MSQFYLQDSRSHVGDGLTFWALGVNTTNLVKAALFTAERAKRTATPTSRGRRTTLMRGPAWVWTVR
ncbi:hypothetical protein [Pseudomonas viridiflava]|uniref:hypothetical protein n=1 Tax=Pseudomonas viridiflava TaxID=33069 RepID=UPI001F149C5E|nr:hypothetical protein [Pseudomonas viridiflava]